jgi:hypothetical protein
MTALQTGRVLAVVAGILAIGAEKPDGVKSGPQVGAQISKSFDVRLCNGPEGGDMACLV